MKLQSIPISLPENAKIFNNIREAVAVAEHMNRTSSIKAFTVITSKGDICVAHLVEQHGSTVGTVVTGLTYVSK